MFLKLSKFVKLGILIVVSLTILIWGLSYLKGNDIFKKNSHYHVVYERVDGLLESNKVIMNGYQIGQVEKIQFAPDKSGRLIVSVMIDSDFSVPVNSVAQIISSDIMGTRAVRMILSDEEELYRNNDTIPGAIEGDLKEQVSMQVLPIKNKAEQLLSTLDSAITVLTVIFNEDARQDLSESFANINKTIENIELTTNDLQEIVATGKGSIQRTILNIDELTTTLRNNAGALETTIKNFASFSDTLANFSLSPIVTNISDASQEILAMLEKMNSTESTAGLLLNDDELYLSIAALSNNLSFLINDIQANPKRYVQLSALNFGKEYYITTSGDVASKSIVFKVHLISTENKVPLDAEIFKGLGKVEEFEASGAYSYLLGATSSYTEIKKLKDETKGVFPESSIVAFKNGRLIKLEKALKTLR